MIQRLALAVTTTTILFFVSTWNCWGENWTNKEIVDAIFKAEGGYGADYLYGIRSVSYKNDAEARQICLRTVQNQRRRHFKHKCDKTYLECLSARYAPLQAQNDPLGLNRHWLKNVLYFLNNHLALNNSGLDQNIALNGQKRATLERANLK